MAKKVQKKKTKAKTQPQEVRHKDFLDIIAPAAVKFNTDHYICGSLYHCTLALRSYPATTEELALLRHLGEKSGVTLSIYTRQVTAAEENGILHNAENKNRMARSSTNSMKAAVTAEGNLQDVAELIAAIRLDLPADGRTGSLWSTARCTSTWQPVTRRACVGSGRR